MKIILLGWHKVLRKSEVVQKILQSQLLTLPSYYVSATIRSSLLMLNHLILKNNIRSRNHYYPCFRWEKWSTGRISNVSRTTQVINTGYWALQLLFFYNFQVHKSFYKVNNLFLLKGLLYFLEKRLNLNVRPEFNI
jgi:hypothetical protein